ncbi:AF4/FMR2 family member 4 [Elysia marginata]|uniref:AF4/FMR2 family member lilli n=1 Tax=Elysia marginata TaxID=1093978 RepID=A0AAV4JAJ4_9GAST|nr:AF4/FMR2 family member 4 [Elysia marginata]
MSSGSSSLTEKNRKLMVLIIRLRSYLLHAFYKLRRQEASRVKREIEENKPPSSSSHKPHAPSPHQASNHWNKNSTGTPSPMSPTPSPAGSVSSQGSASEHIPGKLPNGNAAGSVTSASSMTSPSPGHGVMSIHQRYMKYFQLTCPLVKATELWDQADAEARCVEDFFNTIDKMCGPLAFHSKPQVVVRYMKYALEVLNL